MTDQSIHSEDMTLKQLFQDFYRVPDYQREFVWGEKDQNGNGGDEVEQFLSDIYQEFESANTNDAPEYFIGTVVVCPSKDNMFDLIDGQQRTTTVFITLCAIRDLLIDWTGVPPEDLSALILSTNTDWKGESTKRLRVDLQYQDGKDVLTLYAEQQWESAPTSGTRSICNIANAYKTVREFLISHLHREPKDLKRFYGYLTNKVKLIRIKTPSVAKALKTFETINDRGIGLDAMDLLKNLLFMNTHPSEFGPLKDAWKSITDAVFEANEKPLRFLRYFLLASYTVDIKLKEDAIYDWFLNNEHQTAHASRPLAFVNTLLNAAKAYGSFVRGYNTRGKLEEGIVNTRSLGGSAMRQHYIFLLAGRHLKEALFTELARDIENLMFVFSITSTPANDYERSIVEGAAKLRNIKTDSEYSDFQKDFFVATKARYSDKFRHTLLTIKKHDTRLFRLRYLLAKISQHLENKAYSSFTPLSTYVDARNDVEHILAESPSAKALVEFNEAFIDQELVQRLGNLMLIEQALNRSLGNKAYSEKLLVYGSSKYLLNKCQGSQPAVGQASAIRLVTQTIPSFAIWTRNSIEERQKFLANLAEEVWGVSP